MKPIKRNEIEGFVYLWNFWGWLGRYDMNYDDHHELHFYFDNELKHLRIVFHSVLFLLVGTLVCFSF